MFFFHGESKKSIRNLLYLWDLCVIFYLKKYIIFFCVRNFEIFRSTYAYSTGHIYVLEGTLDNMFRLFGKLLYGAKTYKKIRQESLWV